MTGAGASVSSLRASLAVAIAGACWGLFWLPLRALEADGIAGAWASMGFYVAALPVILLLTVWRWRRLREGGRALVLTTAVTGLAMTCYAVSFLLTDVVRTLLLFYLTPIWGTLLAWLLLGERMTRGRVAALILACAGMVVILDAEGGSGAKPYGWIGDALGLAAGVIWAYGSLRLYQRSDAGGIEQGMGLFAWAALFSILMLPLLPAATVGPPPDLEVLLDNAVFAVAFSGGLYLGSACFILWGAMHLDPGRVGILMMGEIVIGVSSAALLTDEPFGLREALGTGFILAAAAVEMLASQPTHGTETA